MGIQQNFRDFLFNAAEILVVIGTFALLLQPSRKDSQLLTSCLRAENKKPPELCMGTFAMDGLEVIGLGTFERQMVHIIIGAAQGASEGRLVTPFTQFLS